MNSQNYQFYITKKNEKKGAKYTWEILRGNDLISPEILSEALNCDLKLEKKIDESTLLPHWIFHGIHIRYLFYITDRNCIAKLQRNFTSQSRIPRTTFYRIYIATYNIYLSSIVYQSIIYSSLYITGNW